MKVNALDLSPNYSGTLMAITNGLGSLTGILTPLVVGEITTNKKETEWQLVFWIVFVVSVLGNVIFVLWASGEPQPWNDPEFLRRKDEENGKSEKKVEYGNGTFCDQKKLDR